jgi:hypothetical protein
MNQDSGLLTAKVSPDFRNANPMVVNRVITTTYGTAKNTMISGGGTFPRLSIINTESNPVHTY